MADKIPCPCSRCNRVVQVNPTGSGAPRPPVGWTNIDGSRYWCGDCWDDVYVPRAATISVTVADWDAFRAVLRETMGAARSLANWAYARLMMAESGRDPAAEKIDKKPSVYLYGEAKNNCPFWGILPAQIGNSVLKQVESDYATDRYEMRWTGARSARNYTYPQPIPIPGQCWTLAKTDDGYTAAFPLATGQRVTVGLACRKHQVRILDRLLSAPLLVGACKLIESRSYADRDKGSRTNSGGSRYASRIRLMISYYSPRDEALNVADNEWRVSTCADSLLVAIDPESCEVWRYHADHAKRIADRHGLHLARLSRLSDDRKAETRRPKRDARPRVAMLDAISERDRNRMRSLCHEISAQLIAAAKRRRVSRIVYDDSAHEFSSHFPYAMLRLMIDQKARAARIAFMHASGAAPKKRREPLAK